MAVATASANVGSRRPPARREGCQASIWLLVLINLLVAQLMYFNRSILDNELPMTVAASQTTARPYALDYPRGTAVALPSVRASKEEEEKINRDFYGGSGDKVHLGGFVEIDLHGISPAVWKYMVQFFGVKSVLDVGCGRGISTSWFALHGVEALCVEGSHDAVMQTMLPSPITQVVEHDFSRGPWWPPRTVDAIWCVEFLEHVGRNFHHNYLPAFRSAALIFATNSRWGGWHHVEVHDDIWWISKFQSYGFVYSEELSNMVKEVGSKESSASIPSMTGKPYNAQHVWTTVKVYINPAVAALPEHAHLFADHGCYDAIKSKPGRPIVNRECGTGRDGAKETPLPKSFYPLNLTDAMDKAWEDLVKKNIKVDKK